LYVLQNGIIEEQAAAQWFLGVFGAERLRGGVIMEEDTKKDEILFDLGKGKLRRATIEEIKLGITPPQVEAIICLRPDGKFSRQLMDPLGR